MIIDAQNLFSSTQVLGSGATVSTNLIDLSSDRNIGIGEPIAVVINILVAADFADADETYQFDVETDDNSGFSSANVIVTRSFTNADSADLGSGDRIVLPLPNDLTAEQFLRLNYTLGGTTPSITVTAHLQPQSMIQNEVPGGYPDNITIS